LADIWLLAAGCWLLAAGWLLTFCVPQAFIGGSVRAQSFDFLVRTGHHMWPRRTVESYLAPQFWSDPNTRKYLV
jgi:hypothetical protein